MSDINRRQWQRLEITEPTVALDSRGRELGKIIQASGGGIALEPGPSIADDLSVGSRNYVSCRAAHCECWLEPLVHGHLHCDELTCATSSFGNARLRPR